MIRQVVLISIDDLRYDCMGYHQDKDELLKYDALKNLDVPTLDGIANSSLCFSKCVSTNTYTTSAHASILTGLYPPGHGVRAFYLSKLSNDVFTLAEIFKVHGYKTVFASDVPANFVPLGLSRGFDCVLDNNESSLFKFLDANKESKVFLFVHFIDVHEPYLFSHQQGCDNSDYFSAMKSLYEKSGIRLHKAEKDAMHLWFGCINKVGRGIDMLLPLYVKGVSKFDQNRFRVFIELLRQLNFLDGGLLVIFSDHGEGIMFSKRDSVELYGQDRSGWMGHGGALLDSQIRVPLLIHQKDFSHRIEDALVSLVDIFPTVVETALDRKAGELFPYALNGHNVTGSDGREDAYSECWLAKNQDHPWNMMSFLLWQRAIRTDKGKFIIYGEPEMLSENILSGLDDSEFLKQLYRKGTWRFENLNDFMRDLQLLREGTSREDLLLRYRVERAEFFDLVNDPHEEKSMSDIAGDMANSYRDRINLISAVSTGSERIFEPLDVRVIERITRSILLDDLSDNASAITGNKKLFSDVVRNFTKKNEHLSDEEFLDRCYRLFLGRPADREDIQAMLGWMQKDFTRSNFLLSRMWQLIVENGREESVESDLKSELKNKIASLEEKESAMRETEDRLKDALKDLNMVHNSRTWRIMQTYSRIFGPEAKWRKGMLTRILQTLFKNLLTR